MRHRRSQKLHPGAPQLDQDLVSGPEASEESGPHQRTEVSVLRFLPYGEVTCTTDSTTDRASHERQRPAAEENWRNMKKRLITPQRDGGEEAAFIGDTTIFCPPLSFSSLHL
ncbi:unnamed protein product [Pleuronectes platessa]|uniref:Uncharacterized protein n=1 Tax=Pleuronectes platessa TaxID=8262 RepID=A0A9N7Z0S8_PLEPL|nr:unnamed protein product [Pleuronectes platessa]